MTTSEKTHVDLDVTIARRPDHDDGWIVELFDTHYLALVRLAMQLVDTQEAAEEIVQDVFTAIYRRGRDAAPKDPGRYLKRAVVNRSRSVLRGRLVRRRSLQALTGQLARAEPRATDETVLAVTIVRNAIRSLPRRQREVLVLRYYEGLSPDEAAELLQIRPGAVNASLHRALQTMKTLLRDEVVQ